MKLDWLTELLQHEIDARRDNAQRLRFKQAGFPAACAIEHFDFGFNPEIDAAHIRDPGLICSPPAVGRLSHR